MKTAWFIIAATCATSSQVQAQVNFRGPRIKAEGGPYSIVERGQHYRVWSRVALFTNEFGQAAARTNSFTELSTGLHRWVNGRWIESEPELILTNNGVLGRGAGHELRLPANLNTRSAVQVRTPDGQWLKSHILGLAYHDTASGSNVLIAELKDCRAQVGSNAVIYANAFTDFRADVSYEYRKSGVAQWITLRERPPAPEQYGMVSASTHLLVLSEFTEFPAAQVRKRSWRSGRDVLRDDALDFGTVRLGRGRAFGEGKRRTQYDIPVSKQWETLSARQVLVERVPFSQMHEELRRLPATADPGTTNASVRQPARWFAAGTLPARLESRLQAATRSDRVNAELGPKLANSEIPNPKSTMAPGFVIDWELVAGSGWWMDFHCNRTYLIYDEVHLSGATCEFGAVLKYDLGSSLHIDGPFYGTGGCSGHPAFAVLTSINDDDYGAWIPGSTGEPSFGEYGPALVVRQEDLATAQNCLWNHYGDPGIIASPPQAATVTVTASDPTATKGGDAGAFRITRVNGDWNQSLTVPFAVTGTGVAGTDYQPIGTSATIPANQGSVVVSVLPSAAGGSSYDSTVVLTLQSSSAYQVGSPQNASVTVYDLSVPPPPPATTPTGLVGWWRGENDAADGAGANHGTLAGNTAYGWGKVGRAFGFDGNAGAVRLGNPANLRLQNFTVETWIKRNSSSIVTYAWHGSAGLICYGYAGYSFGIWNDGRLFLSKVGIDAVTLSAPVVADTEWHHVALTRSGSTVVFYIDGAAYPVPAYGSVFSFNTDVAIGARGDNLDAGFYGSIDEMSFYDRPLSPSEIQTIYHAGRGGKLLDADTDGLPDTWEFAHWGNVTAQNSSGDPDADGLTNLQEYQGGTDPTIANVSTLPVVIIAAADAVASEIGPDTGKFIVMRMGGDQTAALVVNFQSPTGSAVNGTDYGTLPGSVTIPANQSSASVFLTPIQDATGENTETAVLALQAGGAYAVGNPANATVNIVDAYGDTDGDGLADAMEAVFGTKPLVFDDLNTPPNGMADWKEDYDGDGLPDACERIAGSGLTWNVAEPAPGLPAVDKCPLP